VPGTSFDRVADHYDDSRGGDRRGGHFAAAIAPWLPGPRVVEAGVGTGAIARGLTELGHPVVGVDLSVPMLTRAVDRIGRRVVVGDADRLPLADRSVDGVVLVWVLQLVDDPRATLAEAARAVRAGGRVISVLSFADDDPDDEMATILSGLRAIRRGGRGLDPVLSIAPRPLRLVHAGHTPWQDFSGAPAEQIRLIEERSYSSLFELDDRTWAEVVDPVLERLRALPDPDRPRRRRNRHPLVVWEVDH
jgi:SAM-dependent methyltransferase